MRIFVDLEAKTKLHEVSKSQKSKGMIPNRLRTWLDIGYIYREHGKVDCGN